MTQSSPFRYFKTSPEVIRLAVMLYIRFPLFSRNVEDLLHERGIEVSHVALRGRWQLGRGARSSPTCRTVAATG